MSTATHANGDALHDMDDLLIGGGRFRDDRFLNAQGREGQGSHSREQGIHYVLSLVSASRDMKTPISMAFFPHGISANPSNPHLLTVVEKQGPGACQVDLRSRTVINTISPSSGCWFYGHGTYDASGSLIYLVETELLSGRGLLSVRDVVSGEIIGQLDTYGASPHDCLLLADGTTLAITNAGEYRSNGEKVSAACVSYVDSESGKLLDKKPISNTRINAGHLLIAPDQSLAVVSAPREDLPGTDPGGLSIGLNNGELISLMEPEQITGALVGESLSLAYHQPSDLLGITTPDAGLVTFWRLSTRQFVSAVRIPEPRGICLTADATEFVVSSGSQVSLYGIDVEDQSRNRLLLSQSYISGSHMLNWAAVTGLKDISDIAAAPNVPNAEG